MANGVISNPQPNPTSSTFSFSELLSRVDKQSNVLPVIEILNETNEILEDMRYKESDQLDGITARVRASLPKSYWLQLNQGIPASKTGITTIKETFGCLGSRSEIGKRMINRVLGSSSPDQAKVWMERLKEDRAHMEALGQDVAECMFYGNAKADSGNGFNGFACRYNTLSKTIPSSKNVIDCGGTGDNLTSIYIVKWSDSVYVAHPKSAPAGIEKEASQEIDLFDDQGLAYRGYRTDFYWTLGLVIEDWRNVVRLCNINIDDLMNGKGIGSANVQDENTTNLILKLNQGLSLLPKGSQGNVCIYMNGDCFRGLNDLDARCSSNVIRLKDALNAYGTQSQWESFRGAYPIRQVDRIINGETQVTEDTEIVYSLKNLKGTAVPLDTQSLSQELENQANLPSTKQVLKKTK